jgi:DNA-binding winged helix-turn-helix (wHTH) protein/tetratricopeptide (TPR) repeat protein
MDSDIPRLRADREIQLAHERPFRLAALEVRPATREVVGPRGREVLEPRVMQVLVALARAQGEVVGRDDLIASCWEGRVVGEDAISRVISRLRRLTEGIGRDGWTLETVTKVGYRLVPAGQDPAALRLTPVSAPGPSRRIMLAAGAGLAAAGGGFLWWRSRRQAVSPEVRALYDKGREALGLGLPETTDQALGFLREAVAQAPDFAEAWGALALAYQASLLYTEPSRQAGVTAQAEAAAKRALELDPDEAQANAALALMAPVYRNWTAAERLYDRALRLHAGNPKIEMLYARLLLGVGRIKASVERAQAAVAGDEYSVWHHQILGQALWSAGRVEEADRVVAKALARWPRHYVLWFLQHSLLTFSGRADRAVAMGHDTANWPINIPKADMELHLLVATALAGHAVKDIEAAASANMAAARRGAGYAENAIECLSAMGRPDDAFAIARALYFGKGFAMPGQRFSTSRFIVGGRRLTHFLFMPATDAIRSDPRFGPLMRDIGIADYWKASGHGPDDPASSRGA